MKLMSLVACMHFLQSVLAGEPALLSGITDEHNVKRALHTAGGPLTWDDNLAASAQAWANVLKKQNSCKSQHSNKGKFGKKFAIRKKGVGENIAFQQKSTTKAEYSTPEALYNELQPVDAWHSEVKCFTWPQSSKEPAKCDMNCAHGQGDGLKLRVPSSGCGHMEQMVWKDGTKVGCGSALCKEKAAKFHVSSLVIVCHYDAARVTKSKMTYQKKGPDGKPVVDRVEITYNQFAQVAPLKDYKATISKYLLPKEQAPDAPKQKTSHLRKGGGAQQTLDNSGPGNSGDSGDDTGDKGPMVFPECLHPKSINGGASCQFEKNTCKKPVLVKGAKSGKVLLKIPVFKEKSRITLPESCWKKGIKCEIES